MITPMEKIEKLNRPKGWTYLLSELDPEVTKQFFITTIIEVYEEMLDEVNKLNKHCSTECSFCDGYPPCEIEMGRDEALTNISESIKSKIQQWKELLNNK